MCRVDGDDPAPDDPDGKDDCKRRATLWELKTAGIDPHEVKPQPWSRFEICKCKSGGFAIKRYGTGKIIERL